MTGYTLDDPEQSHGANNPAETKPSSIAADFAWESKSKSHLKVSTGLHESGITMTFYGCSKCPSTLFKTCKEGFPGIMILLAGSVDGEYVSPKYGIPMAELWVPHRLPWVKEIDGAKQCQAFT